MHTMKNSKSTRFTTLTAVAFCMAMAFGMKWNLTAADAEPNPPQLLSYQGYLSDKDGVPIGNSDPVNYDVVFRIYDAEEASANEVLLWSEQQTVTFDAGNFSVLLGAGKEFSSSEPYGNLSDVFDNVHVSEVSERYIGITVQGIGQQRYGFRTGSPAATVDLSLRLPGDQSPGGGQVEHRGLFGRFEHR